MHLRSTSFQPYDFFDPRFAFGRYDARSHIELSDNVNPHLAWSDVPDGARSFALLAWDPEVPTRGEDVNKEGRSVATDVPRADFFHWVAIDLPAALREIPEASHSAKVTHHGKHPGPTPHGGLQGLNDYTGWFAGNEDMGGDYAGYDGMGPPWNDERVHAYHFAVYALDVPTLGLAGRFTGHDVRKAMLGHILADARLSGLYTLNPRVGARYAQRLADVWLPHAS